MVAVAWGELPEWEKRKTERPMKLLIKLQLLKDESDMKSVNLISLSNVLQLAMHSVRCLRQKTLLFSTMSEHALVNEIKHGRLDKRKNTSIHKY